MFGVHELRHGIAHALRATLEDVVEHGRQERGALQLADITRHHRGDHIALPQDADELPVVATDRKCRQPRVDERRDRGAERLGRPQGGHLTDQLLAERAHAMYLSEMYAVPTAIDRSVAGMPTLRKGTNPIGRPARSAMPAAATFAAAAMSVALPPKHAPIASAHQYASSPGLSSISCSTTGIIVAVKGMLSTAAEPIAEPHVIPSSSAVRSPPVTSAIQSATSLIAPTSSRAPTMTISPRKKKSIDQSIPESASSTSCFVTRSITVAPANATVATSRCSGLWRKNRRIVPIRTGIVRLSSSGSSIDFAASSCMMRCRA